MTLILAIVSFYLFFVYVGFYYYIGKKSMPSPYTSNSFTLNDSGKDPVLTYVALGDSLTSGVGSETIADTYVFQFAERLSKSSNKVQAYNLGIPGARTDEILNYELPQIIKLKPDVITLLVGINDIHDKKQIKVFEENYSTILNILIKETSAKIYIITIPLLGSNYILLPPFNTFMRYKTKHFNEAIYVAVNNVSDSRIKVLDLYKYSYKFSQSDLKYYSRDLYHPSGYGYSLWGDFLNAD